MKQTTLVVGCVVGLILTIAGWREFHHVRSRHGLQAELEAMRATQLKLESSLQAETLRADACYAERGSLTLEMQGLQDRCTNLVAQRDHLKAELERQARLSREQGETIAQVNGELQALKQDLYLKAALPRELEAKLAQAAQRIRELEDNLDQQFQQQAYQPAMHAVDGITRDGTVLALGGPTDPLAPLPQSVLVCRANTILLSGWINRLEDDAWILHSGDWQVSPSALVKGEKVFILPVNYHEPDP